MLLAQKMETVGRMASSVIHDLNNLLTVIQLNAALLEDLGEDPDERARMIGEINRSCEAASELTRHMLAFARGKATQVAPVHLQRLLGDLTGFLQCLLPRKAKMETHLCEEPLWVRGDRSALGQAVMNLVLNALDAAPGEGVRLELVAREGLAVISVIDRGCGIRSENLPHIFEPFFTTKPGDKGTGLGLTIVQRVVNEHHGRIEVESEPDQGTTFRLYLPIAAEHSAEVSPAKAEVPTGTPAPAGFDKWILLVEDDPGIRRIAAQMLTKRDYRVLEAADTAEAKAIWQERSADIGLLFTDVILPGSTSGEDLAAELRTMAPELPVLYSSGNAGALRTPGVPFIAKPYPPEALIEKVKSLVG